MKKKFKIPDLHLMGTDDEVHKREELLEKLKPVMNNQVFEEESIKVQINFKVDFNKEKDKN